MTHPREGTYRYARLHQVDDYLRLGWMLGYGLGPTHGHWSIAVYWPCECKERVPA